MKCANCFNCNGIMILKSKSVEGNPDDGHFTFYDDSPPAPKEPLSRVYPQGETGVAAHTMPVFAQCCECGYAPGPEDQPDAVKQVLQEYLKTT